jgi:carbonic anhydrase
MTGTENGTLSVHDWVYGLHDGLLRDLAITVTHASEVPAACTPALAAL